MKGTITIDCGNTRVKAAVFVGNDLSATTMFAYDEIAVLDRFLSSYMPEAGIVSTVVHHDGYEAVSSLLKARVPRLHRLTHDTSLPITVCYEHNRVGLDRVAAAVGAHALCRGVRLLVADAGTALTLDVVDLDGAFLGGYICAGVNLALSSLHEHTSQLPAVSADSPVATDDLPHNTEQAMRQGAVLGAVAQIDACAVRHRCDLIALTGGDAKLLAPLVAGKNIVEPHLVAHGLNTILQHLLLQDYA